MLQPSLTALQKGYFLQAAQALGDRILKERLYSDTEGYTWLVPRGYGTPENPLRITKIGPHLYNGTCGLALFLAALGRISGVHTYAEAGLKAIEPLRRKLHVLVRHPAEATRAHLPPGGLIGIGSFIYSFLTIGRLLEKPELLQEAFELAGLLTEELIMQDDVFRIQRGVAGGLLSLLALRREMGSEEDISLKIAVICAQHLARSSNSYQGRPPAWHLSPNLPPVCDFCYGSAGIRYALLKLFEIFPHESFWATAEDAQAFERSLYSADHRNWVDLRFSDRMIQFMWCHGTAGLALGKIAALPIADTHQIREEIAIAVDATIASTESERFDINPYDDLCCGHMGRVEVLHTASWLLGRTDLYETALSLAERVVNRAERAGCYGLTSSRNTGVFDPSLFQGAAGIGYTLLRLLEPRNLPCILLLD